MDRGVTETPARRRREPFTPAHLPRRSRTIHLASLPCPEGPHTLLARFRLFEAPGQLMRRVARRWEEAESSDWPWPSRPHSTAKSADRRFFLAESRLGAGVGYLLAPPGLCCSPQRTVSLLSFIQALGSPSCCCVLRSRSRSPACIRTARTSSTSTLYDTPAMFKSVMQLSLFSFLLSLLAFAYALPIAIRDVFVPPVTSPATGTVWTVGSQQNVTW